MALNSVEAKIEAALFTRVASISLTPALAIAWDGVNFPGLDAQGRAKPKPASYLRVDHDPDDPQRPLIASNSQHRYSGRLALSLMLEIGSTGISSTASREIAATIADYFPVDDELEFEGVAVRVMKRPHVVNGYRDDSDERWRIPIIVQYECWHRP